MSKPEKPPHPAFLQLLGWIIQLTQKAGHDQFDLGNIDRLNGYLDQIILDAYRERSRNLAGSVIGFLRANGIRQFDPLDPSYLPGLETMLTDLIRLDRTPGTKAQLAQWNLLLREHIKQPTESEQELDERDIP